MFQVINGGQAEFDSLVYGQSHPGTVEFLRGQVQAATNMFSSIGTTFQSSINNMFEKFHGSEAQRLAKIVHRKITNIFTADVIRPLWEIEEFHQAQLGMQRWVMANPMVRDLYHQQLCDGYSTTYVDMQPGAVGEKQRDYRLVMDGIAQVDDDGVMRMEHYFEDHGPDETPFMLADQVDIISSWDAVEYYLKKKDRDPVSPWGDSLS